MIQIAKSIIHSSIFATAASVFLSLSTPGFSETTNTVVDLTLNKIFAIENGFDTNDYSEIAVLGTLPNTCYKVGKSSAYVDTRTYTIKVNVEGYRTNERFCADIAVPFLTVIKTGQLRNGNYTVESNHNPNISSLMAVSEAATDSRDDHLYAPVDTVELVESLNPAIRSAGQQKLILKGSYPHMLQGCMRITEIKKYRTPNNILVVMPITNIFETAEECQQSEVNGRNRYKVEVPVQDPIFGKGLVHVRTLNGQALNKLVVFPSN